MSMYQARDTLYYIDALLKYSNYNKAAKSLYISQPYLTQVIKRIEGQLNCELINRSKLPYRLTEQGKIYYQYLTTLENNYSNLVRELSAISDLHNKTIKIGVLPSLGTYILPLFLPKFLAAHPGCRVDLFENIPETNEKLILNNELDFWIGQNSENISPNLNAIKWGYHRYYAIIPKSSAFYQKDIAFIPTGKIEIQDLLCQSLVLTRKGSAIRKQIDQLLSLYKIEPKIVMESTEINTVQKLAMSNLGVTFVPESILIEACPSKYNIYELPIEELHLDYFIAHHCERKLSPLEKDLINSFSNQSLEPCEEGDLNE